MKKLTFHILALFPEMFSGPFSESIVKRAQEKGIIDIILHNLRDFAEDKHKTVDDTPYGGGAGMVLKVDIAARAITSIKSKIQDPKSKPLLTPSLGKGRVGGVGVRTILLSPQGKKFDQRKAEELSGLSDIILVCGHYEGFDERIRQHLIDEEISIGDFVLSGGELPAMIITDAVTRLLPGVLGNEESTREESFSYADESGRVMLEYPLYTKPAEYQGWAVPEILLSGDHQKIARWRKGMAFQRTSRNRPDLVENQLKRK